MCCGNNIKHNPLGTRVSEVKSTNLEGSRGHSKSQMSVQTADEEFMGVRALQGPEGPGRHWQGSVSQLVLEQWVGFRLKGRKQRYIHTRTVSRGNESPLDRLEGQVDKTGQRGHALSIQHGSR